MIDVGGLANEQCVVLNDLVEIIPGDELGIESGLECSFVKTFQCAVVRRRVLILGINEDRQVVFLFILPIIPSPEKIFFERLDEHRLVGLRNLAQADGLDTVQHPLVLFRKGSAQGRSLNQLK